MLTRVKTWVAKNPSRKTAYFVLSFPYRLIKHNLRAIKCQARGEDCLKPSGIHRRSKRVYILGSGYSVASIKLWGKIQEHDSIGFNFWVLHPFVPNMYFLEVPRDKVREEALLDALRNRAVEYSKTSVVVVDDEEICATSQLEALLGNYYKYVGLAIAAPSAGVYRIVMSALFSRFKKSDRLFCQGGSSVDRIVSYCILSGYKEIVLCGVDLNNVNYFYENPKCVDANVRMCVPATGQERRMVHKTNDPNEVRMGITVRESIMALLPFCYASGVEIYIESPESDLADILPVMKH